LRTMQDELAHAQAERMTKQSEFELISSAPVETLPIILDNSTLHEYGLKLTDLRRQLAELRSTVTPAHPSVRKVEAEMAVIEQAIEQERQAVLTRASNDYDESRQREAMFNKAYIKQLALVNRQAAKSVQYNMLKREVDSERKLYETMLQRVQELGLAAAMRSSTIRIVDSAVVPAGPYSPNWKIDVAAGFVVGTLLG
jgi:succinoglycan biosynthesis transport protein ExoP